MGHTLVLSRFDAAVGDVVLDGGADEVAPFAHGASAADERCDPGALGPGIPPVQ